MKKPGVIKTKQAHVVYENAFVTVFDNDVEFPSGQTGKYYRSRWKAPHGVAILPIHRGNPVLLEQYRYAELCFSVEAPQGFGEVAGQQEDDAHRELQEEMGCRALALRSVGTVGHDYKTYLYFATLPDDFEPNHQHSETTEAIIDTHVLDRNKPLDAHIERFGIFDPVTLILLMRWQLAIRDEGF